MVFGLILCDVAEYDRKYAARVPLIVSRHPAAIEFLKAEAARLGLREPEVAAQVTSDDMKARVVLGDLPMHLARHAGRFLALEFDGAPPRGREYGVKEMRDAGARLTEYVVMPPSDFLAFRQAY